MNTCGKYYLQNILGENINNNEIYDLVNSVDGYQHDAKLFTSYLGQVELSCVYLNSREYLLDCIETIDETKLQVRVLDAKQHNLNAKIKYSFEDLMKLEPVKINILDNKIAYYLNLLIQYKMKNKQNIYDRINQFYDEHMPEVENYILPFIIRHFKDDNKSIEILEKLHRNENVDSSLIEDKIIYSKLLQLNSYVDIHFNTLKYLEFLNEKFGIAGINNNNVVISLANNDFDNAYWNGSYMMYGNGKDQFYPLVSADVVAHELTHGLISATADLEYKGESGALNESFADIFATTYEFWLYEKFNKNKNLEDDILGDPDWFIGEDLTKESNFLRNMLNPLEGNQPKEYKGDKWFPTHSPADNGGVHINSGVPNYLYYLICSGENLLSKDEAIKIFYNCLTTCLNNKSNFSDLKNGLCKLCKGQDNEQKIIDCINNVGLNNNNKQNQNIPNRPMPNRPMPNRPNRPMPNRPNRPMPNRPNRPMPNRPMPNRPMPNRPIPNRPNRPRPNRPIPNRPNRPMPNRPMPNRPMPNRPIPNRPMPNRPNRPMPNRKRFNMFNLNNNQYSNYYNYDNDYDYDYDYDYDDEYDYDEYDY